MRALFPISLSNQSFGTAYVEPALRTLPDQFREVLFLVADQLQLYNKALRIGEDGTSYREALLGFANGPNHFEERSRWIERLSRRLQIEQTNKTWRVCSIDDFADGLCFRIMRNVIVAYDAIDEFRRDVRAAARRHALVRSDLYPLGRAERLSRSYVLEEIALSVRVRVIEGFTDEFYLGKQADVVERLYAGHYGASVYDLAQVEPASRQFRFWAYHAEGCGRWVEDAQGCCGVAASGIDARSRVTPARSSRSRSR